MTEKNSAVLVARGASFVFIQNIGSTVIQIIAFAIIARLISQVDMGILATLTLMTGLFSTLVNLGLPSAATKFMAESVGKGDRLRASGVCYQILRVTLILSIVAASLCFIFSDSISLVLLRATTYTRLFKLLSVYIVVYGIFCGLRSSLIGLQKIREAAIFELFKLGIRQILIVWALLSGFGLFGVVVAWIIAGTINCLLYITVIFKSLGPPTFSFSLRRLLKFSYPLYFSGIVAFMYGWFDRILLLAFCPLSELGVYDVVLRAFNVLSGVTVAISTALFPKYSEIKGRYGITSIEKAIPTASRYICYTTVPLAFGLSAIAKPAISLFAGEAYAIGSKPLMILSFFFAVTCIQTALSGILLTLEKTRIAAALTVTNVAVGIILGLVLLPLFGVVGASISRGITMILGLVLNIWVLRKQIDFTLDKEAFWKSLISSFTMALVVGVFATLLYGEYLLPFYLLLGIMVYLIMLKILNAARKTDLELIRLYLGKRLEFLIKPIEIFLLGQETS